MNAKQFSILVVEDEPDGQELVSRMLSQSNVAVDVAGNAELLDNTFKDADTLGCDQPAYCHCVEGGGNCQPWP